MKTDTYGSGDKIYTVVVEQREGSHTSQGTKYYYVPRRVEVNWNLYGGMRLLQHWSYSNQSQAGTWVLDGEGYMWYTGYLTNGQVPGMYGFR